MNVDLPAPGEPEMPTRTDSPVCGQDVGEQRVGFLAVVGPASTRRA